MNAIFNGNLLNHDEITLSVSNRAFLYADSLFETIIVSKSSVQFLNDHIDRLHRGMKILKLNIPSLLTAESIRKWIFLLLEKEQLEDARLKLIVWRSPGGFFIPQGIDTEFVLLCSRWTPPDLIPRTVDFCNSVFLQESIFSEFKRGDSLPYVLAGIEMRERGLEDLIILDSSGNVGECIYSNIFWQKGEQVYTPSLDTGCIGGVRRKNIIRKLRERNIKVTETLAKPEELLAADHVFTSNVAGLCPIKRIGNRDFEPFIPDYLI